MPKRSRIGKWSLLAACFILACLMPAFAVAQGNPRIEGDVYLRATNGITNGISASIVWLVSDAFAITTIRGACAESPPGSGEARVKWLYARTAKLTASIDSAAVAKSRTGLRGHYLFTGMPPGRYVVILRAFIDTHSYRWMAPVELRNSQQLWLDLDNLNVAETPLPDPFCSVMPP